MSCKYAKKATLGKDYIKCERDNSIHRNPCFCGKRKLTLWERFKEFFK